MLTGNQHLSVIATLGELPHPFQQGKTETRLHSERSLRIEEGFERGANRPRFRQWQHMARADVAAVAVRARATDRPGRILQASGLKRECRCDASCLLKEFFGASGFDPGTQANHGFGVIA